MLKTVNIFFFIFFLMLFGRISKKKCVLYETMLSPADIDEDVAYDIKVFYDFLILRNSRHLTILLKI